MMTGAREDEDEDEYERRRRGRGNRGQMNRSLQMLMQTRPS